MVVIVAVVYLIYWCRYYFFPVEEELSLWEEMRIKDETFWIGEGYDIIC